ncbi:camp-binding domain-like protein [Rhizoclosmatium globosum]|uniref:Camp-binding domain-like protein n=1 Tax=Rhizoclosmatium globosum TaxID=329046 RepID=A0A1Y2CV81_9FUNG|nr:camp-binding domain-like protein [Rhizoclosmatium globosum]|eukprot:ORY50734.1 camp-binding domain-like protein [Rhizoclosmatium globosum]
MVAKNLATKVPFLNRQQNDGRDEEFLGKIGHALIAVCQVNGDYIFSHGDMAEEMYFIKSGTVDIRVESKVVASLKEGDFFGELALIANIPRTATAQATATCILYKLTRESLMQILQEFEDVRAQIDMTYNERFLRFKNEELGRRESVERVMRNI